MTDNLIEQAEALIEKLDESGEIEYERLSQIAADEMMPRLVAEIKRLQAQVASQSESIQILCRDLDPQLHHLMKGKQELREQLAAWQKIAIDERAKQMNGPCDFRTKYEWCDNRQASCDGFPHMWECCPNKDHWRSIAAKELGLQVKQEAGYLERLENNFVISEANLIARQRHGDDWHLEENIDDAYEEARAALEKIRRG